MSFRGRVVACGILAAGSLAAQSSGDKLTGTWTGSIAPPGATSRQPVVVAMKVGTNGSITGVITGPRSPGDIRSGSFDPNTGVLKLEIVVRGDTGTKAYLEGRVQGDSATGQVIVDGQPGDFRLVKTSAALPTAAAPATRPDEATEMVARGFTELSGWVLRAAELVPADKYSYRPTATVRTFAQLVGHVTDGQNYYCSRAGGARPEWSDGAEKGAADKATLMAKLRQSIAACAAVYSKSGQLGPLTENFGHTSLHYGNMITYLRMMGLTPPSS